MTATELDPQRLAAVASLRDAVDVIEQADGVDLDLVQEATVRLYAAAGLTGDEVRSRLPLVQAAGQELITRLLAGGAA